MACGVPTPARPKELDLQVELKVYGRRMSSYRISQLAERCGVPASTLRFYEGAGLLPAERTAAGYRVYGDEALQRLEFIASAKHLGLPLAEIRELLQVWREGMCSTLRSQLLPLVQARLAETKGRIAELTAFSAHLSDVHDQLSGPAPAGACGPGCGCISATPDAGTQTPVMLQLTRPQPGLGASPAEDRTDEAWRSQPVACKLEGSAMSGRLQDWQRLLASCTGREPIPDGLRLTFPTDPALALEVTRLAMAEQDCCSFFHFTLYLSPTTLVLSVRAPETGADMLTDLFGATV
jgi:DNA-binding transcriptional MerR regulator